MSGVCCWSFNEDGVHSNNCFLVQLRDKDVEIDRLQTEIERLRGLSDITRLDVMWQEIVKERYAAEDNAAILAKEVQNLRAEIKQLRGLLREYLITDGQEFVGTYDDWLRRVREALGDAPDQRD